MSSLSPSFGSTGSPDTSQPSGFLPKASRRRDKPQLSCNLCRRRKLKCDRGQPCETCARRGLSLSCTYVQPNLPDRADRIRQSRPIASNSMKDRIGQLESLVTSLMTTLNATKSTTQKSTDSGLSRFSPSATKDQLEAWKLSHDTSQLTENFGRIGLENSETSYVESGHWTAILDGISELKDYFEDGRGLIEKPPPVMHVPDVEEPDLLFGPHKYMTKQEILASLPAKSIVDRIIAKFMNEKDISPVMLHRTEFLNQYEKFWENQENTPVMWIGLLFAIMALVVLFQQFSSTKSDAISSKRSDLEAMALFLGYREKLIECLILGKYTKAAPHTIEALILFLQIEYIRSEDTQAGNWIVLGVIGRLAFRMGYHREPSHSSRISIFEGEMRRRTWAVIIQFDQVLSAQVGLPGMIDLSQSDTTEPRNLMDEDFDENTVELPSSRPDTDPTPVQFIVAKNKLVVVFGKVSALTTSPHPFTYDEVMSLDKVLHDTYKSLPPGLHMRPMSKSIMDTSQAIMRRIFLVLLFHRGQCILHRQHSRLARTDNRYTYSRTSCLEAALQILHYQSLLHQETQPDGRLYTERWQVSSVIKQEFLLATTILCFELDQDMKEQVSLETQQNPSGTALRDRIVKALHDSYLIWLELCVYSREAQKAAEVLRIVLSKDQRMRTRRSANLQVVDANAPFVSSDSNSPSAGASKPRPIIASSSIDQDRSSEYSSTTTSIGAPSLGFDSLSDWPASDTSMYDFSEMMPDYLDGENWDFEYNLDEILDMSQDSDFSKFPM